MRDPPAAGTDAKLNTAWPNERTSLLSPSDYHPPDSADDRPPSPAHSITTRFFEHVAEGIREQDRARFLRELVRYSSFAWAILSCLCAGSITAYSLYGHMFQERLLYTQIEVNTVSIFAEVALYLPVPLLGLLCDRKGPGWSALLGGILFGAGYFLAAFTYHAGPPPDRGGDGWPFALMCLAFVGIGVGTCAMYLGAVTTCAKNFGRGKHKGFALAAPIASFGLSGMWQSQVGAQLLVERNPDGSKGDVDVFRYFLFLGGLLLGVGLIGSLMLRVVDEEALVTEAIEELERSGILHQPPATTRQRPGTSRTVTYDTIHSTQSLKSTISQLPATRRKSALLNGETVRFLADPTMWLLAGGFFLVAGPGEAFINNLGTIIGTLYPSPHSSLPKTSPATHVSIVAVTSTVARILAGTLSDWLAPSTTPHQRYQQQRRRPTSATSASLLAHDSDIDSSDEDDSSVSSLDPFPLPPLTPVSRLGVSRVALLLSSTLLLSVGQVVLASGAAQSHAAPRFALVSALIGAGYGAAFSLVPIIIGCVWGVENFGTNWGIVATAPAGGAALFGWIYAAVYQHHAADGKDGKGSGEQKCYGKLCYAPSFWAMAAAVWCACVVWTFAWRAWRRRGVAV